MIPFHSVLKYITSFEDFSRPYCVLALLHLAETFGSKIRWHFHSLCCALCLSISIISNYYYLYIDNLKTVNWTHFPTYISVQMNWNDDLQSMQRKMNSLLKLIMAWPWQILSVDYLYFFVFLIAQFILF